MGRRPYSISYKGLVMAGYQGWFRAPGDAANEGWVHYGKNGKFDNENNTVDFWPDVSDYEKTYKTEFKFPERISLPKSFSSADKTHHRPSFQVDEGIWY
ncbi:MAG: hypothetical protein MZV63_09345 [Marinilabiliales bacterium]|nr:hypothetical protein [Marinilabiliales bacterium]